MSDANGTLLATVYDAFSTGDMETVLASFADDIEWHVHGPSPVAGSYTGKREVLEFFSRMMAQYEGTLAVRVTAMVAGEQDGFVKVEESAERPADGVTYTGVHVWGFSGGKCARFESYYDDRYAAFWSGR